MASFVFNIRTERGTEVNSVMVEARDKYEAEAKVKDRYPGSTILRQTK